MPTDSAVLPALDDMIVPDSAFDYGEIAVEHRATVREATHRIKACQVRARDSLIIIGQDLLRIKEVIPHRQFGKWIETEFGMGLRTAERLMLVAERFAGKHDTVSLFSDSVLYLLAAPSTPDEAVIAAELQARAGETVTKAKAIEIIDAHKAPPKPAAPSGLPPYVTIWAIEQMVKDWLKTLEAKGIAPSTVLAFVDKLGPSDLTSALLNVAKEKLSGPYRKGDMIQALNNIIEQRRQDARQAERLAGAKAKAIEIIDAHKAPPTPPQIWQLERAINEWLDGKYGPATNDGIARGWVRDDRRSAVGALKLHTTDLPEWQDMAEALPEGWRKKDAVQALANVLEQMHQADRARTIRIDSPTKTFDGRYYCRVEDRDRSGVQGTDAYATPEEAMAAAERGDYTREHFQHWLRMGYLVRYGGSDPAFRQELREATLDQVVQAIAARRDIGGAQKSAIDALESRMRALQREAQKEAAAAIVEVVAPSGLPVEAAPEQPAGASLVEVLSPEPTLPPGFCIQPRQSDNRFVALDHKRHVATAAYSEAADAVRAAVLGEYTLVQYVEWEQAAAPVSVKSLDDLLVIASATIDADGEIVETDEEELPHPEGSRRALTAAAAKPAEIADATRWLRLRNLLRNTQWLRADILPAIGQLTGERASVKRAQKALDPLIAILESNLEPYYKEQTHE